MYGNWKTWTGCCPQLFDFDGMCGNSVVIRHCTENLELKKSVYILLSEFINNIDTDKTHPYIEDCIAKQEPIIKVKHYCLQLKFQYLINFDNIYYNWISLKIHTHIRWSLFSNLNQGDVTFQHLCTFWTVWQSTMLLSCGMLLRKLLSIY